MEFVEGRESDIDGKLAPELLQCHHLEPGETFLADRETRFPEIVPEILHYGNQLT